MYFFFHFYDVCIIFPSHTKIWLLYKENTNFNSTLLWCRKCYIFHKSNVFISSVSKFLKQQLKTLYLYGYQNQCIYFDFELLYNQEWKTISILGTCKSSNKANLIGPTCNFLFPTFIYSEALTWMDWIVKTLNTRSNKNIHLNQNPLLSSPRAHTIWSLSILFWQKKNLFQSFA